MLPTAPYNDPVRRALAPRRRIAAAVALLAAIAIVVVLVLGTGSSSPKAAANSDTSAGDTTVQRRDLVETDTESGTLSYAGSRTVYDRLSGTITWLPHVGQVIKPGQTLFRVGGQPVILMNGTTPAYRDLKSSDSAGQDVLELNRNLVALGFNPDGIVVDDTWQAATTAGVKAFQYSLGESQTGTLALGRVAFLPGAQQVSTVQGTLGASASYTAPSSAPEFVSLEKPTAPSHHKPHSKSKLKQLRQLIAQLKAEIAHMKAGNNSPSPSNSNSNNSNPTNSSSNNNNNSSNNNSSNNNSNHNSPNNGGGGAGTPILLTTSTRLTVTVDLDASKQSEAKVGEAVTVEMPGGSVVNGRITAVSRVAQSSNNGNGGNGSSGSTIPVTIALSGRQSGAGLDKASVSVNFSQAKAKNVLSVPVTALLATGGGRYSVQQAAAPHKLIPVTTGLFAAGYVQISGTGIYPGLKVTDSQG